MPCRDIRPEHPLHEVIVDGQVLRPENGVAVRLEIHFDLVANVWVHVIGTREHEQRRCSVLRTRRQHESRVGTQTCRVALERLEAGRDCDARFLQSEAWHEVAQSLEELLGNNRGVTKSDERRGVAHAVGRENVLPLEESRFDVRRCRHHAPAG